MIFILLIEKNLLKSAADIYFLTLPDLKQLWQKGELAAKKLLQAIENTEYIAGLRLVKENNIEYGPFTEDGALVSYYPYWFCWVQFTLEHGLARKIPADYENLL